MVVEEREGPCVHFQRWRAPGRKGSSAAAFSISPGRKGREKFAARERRRGEVLLHPRYGTASKASSIGSSPRRKKKGEGDESKADLLPYVAAERRGGEGGAASTLHKGKKARSALGGKRGGGKRRIIFSYRQRNEGRENPPMSVGKRRKKVRVALFAKDLKRRREKSARRRVHPRTSKEGGEGGGKREPGGIAETGRKKEGSGSRSTRKISSGSTSEKKERNTRPATAPLRHSEVKRVPAPAATPIRRRGEYAVGSHSTSRRKADKKAPTEKRGRQRMAWLPFFCRGRELRRNGKIAGCSHRGGEVRSCSVAPPG